MTAQQLKNSILQMAVQGKLVPQDPNDEPASVLLERIRAEKEALIKAGKIKKEKNPSVIFRGADNIPYEKVGNSEPVPVEVPFDIPESWDWCRISFANDVYTGNSINEADKKAHFTGLLEGRNYIGTKDVQTNHTISYDNGVKIPFFNNQFRVAPSNSILMCIEGGSAGRKIAITNQDICFGNKLCCFIPYEIDNYFLYYYLQSPLFQEVFKENTTGIIGGVSVNILKNLFLPVPPIREQKRIVGILNKLIPYIEKYEQAENQLNKLNADFPTRLKKSILQLAVQGKLVPQDENDEPASVLLERIREEKKALIKAGKLKKDKNESFIFVRDNVHYENVGGVERCIEDEIPFDIPGSWEWCRLGTLFQHNTGKALNSSNQAGTKYTYITTSNLYWGRFELDNLREMPFTDSELEKCTVVKGDLLVCEGGDIGRASIWEKDYPMRIQNHIHRLRSYCKLDIDFFFYLFMFYKFSGMIGGKGIGIQGLSSNAIHQIPFPLPPLSEQHRIVRSINRLLPICDKL